MLASVAEGGGQELLIMVLGIAASRDRGPICLQISRVAVPPSCFFLINIIKIVNRVQCHDEYAKLYERRMDSDVFVEL